MFWIEVILAIILYFFISRALISFGALFIKIPHALSRYETQDFYIDDVDRRIFLMPVLGEFALIAGLFLCLFYHPILYIDFQLKQYRDTIIQRKLMKKVE